MKRLLALLLAAVCAASLFGCAASDPSGSVTLPDSVTELAAPAAVSMANYPREDDYYDAKTGEWDDDAWNRDYTAWRADYDAKTANLQSVDDYAAYFQASIRTLLSGAGAENRVCSPLNVYLALAMLAEVTDEQKAQLMEQIVTLANGGTVEKFALESEVPAQPTGTL